MGNRMSDGHKRVSVLQAGVAVRPEKPAGLRRRMGPSALLLASLLACAACSSEADRLDAEAQRLCAIDGGIKVYETVTLPASEFSNVGQPLARYAQQAKSPEDRLGPDYRYAWERTILFGVGAKLEAGEGTLVRNHVAITRRADGRLLGESVSYARGGGDGFTFGFQPSGNHCPSPRIDLISSVFIKGD